MDRSGHYFWTPYITLIYIAFQYSGGITPSVHIFFSGRLQFKASPFTDSHCYIIKAHGLSLKDEQISFPAAWAWIYQNKNLLFLYQPEIE